MLEYKGGHDLTVRMEALSGSQYGTKGRLSGLVGVYALSFRFFLHHIHSPWHKLYISYYTLNRSMISMKDMFQEIEIDNKPIQVLRVPWFSQKDTDWLCFVYSLKMVFDFYKNIHPDPLIRSSTPNTHRDELISITNTQYGFGTSLCKSLINKLNTEYPSMLFELKETDYIEVEKSLKAGHPVIVLYNPSAITVNEIGPGHSGVVVGLTSRYVILNNPWYGPLFLLERDEFENAWEQEYNWGIFVKPSPQRRLDSNAAN